MIVYCDGKAKGGGSYLRSRARSVALEVHVVRRDTFCARLSRLLRFADRPDLAEKVPEPDGRTTAEALARFGMPLDNFGGEIPFGTTIA